ncbi:MAG: IS1 family transposase [Opitutaceae bacterium]|nr:IS1 family transposase [Opitutaceae bacterium]
MQTWKFLTPEKQAVAIGALCEGNSIRSVERMTGIHRDTVMRLGVRVGEACRDLMDETMRELPCKKIEVDEIWGFVGKKQRNMTAEDSPELGDVWTWVAIDPESKAVPVFRVGKRDASDANAFMADIAERTTNRLQLSSDGLGVYPGAVEAAFAGEVDYGTIVKSFHTSEPEGKYSPGEIQATKRTTVCGESFRTCTSYVERQNLTMRLHMKRLARLTLGFSKKLENFKAATALHFAYYNFVKTHSTIRCTPAMALGVSSRLWKVEDLVALS